MRHHLLHCAAWAGLVLTSVSPAAWGQPGFVAGPSASPSAAPASASKEERSIADWLTRIHDASRTRNYVGTFVMSSESMLASARITHAADADQEVERVDALTGPARTTFRRNDHVMTFFEDAKVVRIEKREAPGLFPNVLLGPRASIPDFYSARQLGQDRVAGFEADVVLLRPLDGLRHGYRLWSEKRSGLVVKVQTLDAQGRVLEQAAFSDLQIDVPLRPEKLVQKMLRPTGYRTEKLESAQVDPAAEGWELRRAVAGFQSMSCIKRPGAAGVVRQGTVQWVFSDGLASVSLFLEPYDPQRHAKEGLAGMGATLTLTKRMQEWWLTAVGEVPLQTLKAFAQSLERRPN